jgi:hypothetical protein
MAAKNNPAPAKSIPAIPVAQPLPVIRSTRFKSSEPDYEIIDEMLIRMASGQPLTRICKLEHLPTYHMFMSWILNDPDLMASYKQAREVQADYLFDEIIEISDTEYDNYKARNKMDARRFVAARLSPKKYSERSTIDVNQTISKTVKLDLSAMSDDARDELKRALISKMKAEGYDLDAEYTEVD